MEMMVLGLNRDSRACCACCPGAWEKQPAQEPYKWKRFILVL